MTSETSPMDSSGRVSSPFRAPEALEERPPSRPAGRQRAGLLPAGFELREMTGYEEEYLEEHFAESNTAELVNQVLARCLVPPGGDFRAALRAVRALPVAHRDATLLELRRCSLGKRVLSEVTCVACGEHNEVDFDLTEITVEVAAAPETIECHLSDNRRALLRLPNAGDQADLLAAGVESMAGRRTWMLTRVLLRLGDDEEPFDDHCAKALTTKDRRQLEAALEKAVPDLDLSMGVVCQSCGHEFSSPFDVAGFFFSSFGDVP